MIIYEDYFKRCEVYFKHWLSIVVFKFFFYFICAVIVSHLEPNSALWPMDFLTLIGGMPNPHGVPPFLLAYVWTPINGILAIYGFIVSYMMLRTTIELAPGKYDLITRNIRRQLAAVLVISLVAFFAQMLNMFLCWILEFYVLAKEASMAKRIIGLKGEDYYAPKKSYAFRKLFCLRFERLRCKNLENILRD